MVYSWSTCWPIGWRFCISLLKDSSLKDSKLALADESQNIFLSRQLQTGTCSSPSKFKEEEELWKGGNLSPYFYKMEGRIVSFFVVEYSDFQPVFKLIDYYE